jgi:hypothetical protein
MTPEPDDSDLPNPAAPETKGPSRRPRLNALGEERPAFLLDFPHDPELETLIAAFEHGNFHKVRKEAPELAQKTSDPEVRRAALELRRRIDPDRLLVTLLILSFVLFGFLVTWVYTK